MGVYILQHCKNWRGGRGKMERGQKGWQWPWGPCLGCAPWSWGWGSLPLVNGCAGHTWLWSEMGREQVRCGVWARKDRPCSHVLPCGPHTWSKLMWVHSMAAILFTFVQISISIYSLLLHLYNVILLYVI